MVRKVIAFDLDGTLAASKSPITDQMAGLMEKLLEKYQVCVMSGGRFEQFETQLLANLKINPAHLKNLHLMPTCGTRYYRHNDRKDRWQKVYAEDFTELQKKKIIKALNEGIDRLGFREKKTWGETIEDRGSQITFSALGQDVVAVLGEEGVRLKEQWDPEGKKKHKLRDLVAGLIPEFEVRVGGGTSIDITKPGVDKAYGMQKLLDMLGISKEDILFIGDRLEEGGNDFPVKAMGVDCMQVSRWEETALAVEVVLCVT
ncbi:HAD-IIB family hydrolase [Candidatus Saccharibacteria bacterium]|nr:HAD-IIB family hydrolase [Candidatus Saccharibacteria bacterium]